MVRLKVSFNVLLLRFLSAWLSKVTVNGNVIDRRYKGKGDRRVEDFPSTSILEISLESCQLVGYECDQSLENLSTTASQFHLRIECAITR